MLRERPGTCSPYEAILGPDYNRLHPHVRAAHEPPLDAAGTIDVVHGSHPIRRVLVPLMKLPAAGAAQPVRLRVTARDADGRGVTVLHWNRQIGAFPLVTRQRAWRNRLVEEAGAGRMIFALRAVDGALHYEHVSLRVFRIPLPAFVMPRARATVAPAADGWVVDVVVEWRQHLVCRYRGHIRVSRSAP